jgi:hypothetical protein
VSADALFLRPSFSIAMTNTAVRVRGAELTCAYRADAALNWLRRSIAVTGQRGSSHSYSPLFGWSNAYPETTGYLIETLFDYASVKQDPELRDQAFTCADWLCDIQFENGAFPGLLEGHQHPSVFNTAQILFGLLRAWEEGLPKPERYRQAAIRAVRWMCDILEPDGSWQQAAYVPGFTPSYYTRAVWAVIKAGRALQLPEVEAQMRRALHFYAKRFQADGMIANWGFYPDKPAYTHTIAYTLEGFFESALLLNEPEILEKTLFSLKKILQIREKDGKIAGSYDQGWKGNYQFQCVTGGAQLSLLCRRAGQWYGDADLLRQAEGLFQEIMPCQRFGRNANSFGAIPGSRPFWGPYLRGRYPNWAAKFYLDALRPLLQVTPPLAIPVPA